MFYIIVTGAWFFNKDVINGTRKSLETKNGHAVKLELICVFTVPKNTTAIKSEKNKKMIKNGKEFKKEYKNLSNGDWAYDNT